MKFWIFLFFLLVNSIALSQLRIDPLETVHFHRDSIEEHKILSVIVFAEMRLDEDFENGILSGKAREYEFDSTGNVIYKVSSYHDGYYPFAEFGRGSEIEYYAYNDDNLEIFSCTENYKGISELHSRYDQEGNLVLSELTHEGKSMSAHDKISFEWKKGKMVHSELLLTENSNNYYVRHDEQGRLVEAGSDLSKTTTVYLESGDTITEVKLSFNSDTCVRSFVYTRLKQFPNQYVRYEHRNSDGKLIDEVIVKLDNSGNAIEYDSFNYSPAPEGSEVSIVQTRTQVLIENSYDARGLLVKREFYTVDNLTSKKQLFKVYRYIYETTPLLKKFEKGELRQMEIDMNESYGPDY